MSKEDLVKQRTEVEIKNLLEKFKRDMIKQGFNTEYKYYNGNIIIVIDISKIENTIKNLLFKHNFRGNTYLKGKYLFIEGKI